KPSFSIKDNEVEIGMGIHGEKGISVEKMMPIDKLVDIMLDKIQEDFSIVGNKEVSVLINGLGGTPIEEQLIVFRRLSQRLKEMGCTVFMPHIGEFATSMEMSGFSISILKLDEELKRLLAAPCKTPFYTNYNK
ncbi:MAG: dihydroxyacetone kinase subunit DhaK, partial [Erysipelotrichales bacterium]|nr:dihydroxyacetone kinase subunit DhaK [Erysipelotrichales bacterium]